MTAITISRQLGSLGTQIGRRVAQRLGYRMVWREVINEAARRAGAPEVALAAIDDLGLLGVQPSPEALTAYERAVREVMEDLADDGEIVIIGRAGQVILADRPDVLHVRVVAPPEVRVGRIASRQGIPAAAARAQMEESDRSRRGYLRQTYDVAWNDPQLYDLVLNTRRMTVESAADLICQAVRAALHRPPDGPQRRRGKVI
jgi:cytidylate kinase